MRATMDRPRPLPLWPVPQLRQLRADVDRCTALVDSLDLAAVQARGMVLECALAASHLQASPTLLASALRNLVDNAVRYGREQGRIRIESQPLPAGGVRLAVRDDGPGVAASARAQLGQRFFRILGTGQSGNGLGLSIVARIATLHAATLHFEDGLEGRGLGVVLDFPGEVPPG